jgi:ABC-type phosphate transport system substrate-binding protein
MAKTMNEFVKWALGEGGQKLCADLGYAPLPANVVKLEMTQLAKIKVQ